MKHLYLLAVLGCPALARAQSVGIGTSAPNASAALEVRSTSQGFLLPRLSTAQMNAIASPEPGLLIYNTTEHKFYGCQLAAAAPLAESTAHNGSVNAQPNGAAAGQSFRAATGGRLESLALQLRASTAGPFSGTLTVELREGSGLSGRLLATATQTAVATNTFLEWVFPFADAEAYLTAGQSYTFYVAASTLASAAAVQYRVSTANPYADGQFQPASPAFAGWDLVFRVSSRARIWTPLP